MKAIKFQMIGATVALSACVQTSPQPAGPHPYRTRESHLSSRAYECKLKGRAG